MYWYGSGSSVAYNTRRRWFFLPTAASTEEDHDKATTLMWYGMVSETTWYLLTLRVMRCSHNNNVSRSTIFWGIFYIRLREAVHNLPSWWYHHPTIPNPEPPPSTL